MDDSVWELGQAAIAAAWDAARAFDSREGQAERLGGLLEWVDQTQAQLAGLRLELLREAQLSDAVQVLDRDGTSTRRAAGRTKVELRLAQWLGERFPLLGKALCDGEISAAQAEAMVAGLRKLPTARLSAAQLESCQVELLSHAGSLGPGELRALAGGMLEVFDPDAAEQDEAARLEREEFRARAGRSLRIAPDFHGSVRITGQLPLADGALLEAQLAALLPAVASYPDGAPSVEVRRADALVLLCQLAANSGGLPEHGVDRPHLHVTLEFKTLLEGLGHVGIVGHPEDQGLTAGEVRRLACDANLIPVVLGGEGQPLDVGRNRRLATRAQRIALGLRDGGCAFPGCNTRPAACDAHHINPWWGGGATSLENLVFLCPFHHRLVEPDPAKSLLSQWVVRIQPGTGLPEFLPPRWIDPDRKPRQHRRMLLAQMKPHPDDPPTDADAEPDGSERRPVKPIVFPEPKDDPWHPDYQPPPRSLARTG